MRTRSESAWLLSPRRSAATAMLLDSPLSCSPTRHHRETHPRQLKDSENLPLPWWCSCCSCTTTTATLNCELKSPRDPSLPWLPFIRRRRRPSRARKLLGIDFLALRSQVLVAEMKGRKNVPSDPAPRRKQSPRECEQRKRRLMVSGPKDHSTSDSGEGASGALHA